MSREMWYLSRATGIVASLLLVAALVCGFFFSSRSTGTRLRPAWWLDLHNWLGGLALIFTGVHVLATFLDTNSGIGLAQIFVPQTATTDPWSITWGVLALYLLSAVVFSTWPRRLANRRWWRVIHLTSVSATALGLLHAYQSGSDATRLAFKGGMVVAVAVATYALGLRLFSLQRKSRRAGTARDSQPAHSSDSSSPKDDMAEYGHEH